MHLYNLLLAVFERPEYQNRTNAKQDHKKLFKDLEAIRIVLRDLSVLRSHGVSHI